MKSGIIFIIGAVWCLGIAKAEVPKTNFSNGETNSTSNGTATINRANPKTLGSMLNEWPSRPRTVANRMIRRYGQPQEATDSMLIWYNNGPWKRTIIYREEAPHNFPLPHTDFVEQTIDYGVPTHKLEDLARFDGSIIVDRTRGEISARCDNEEMNFLTLNLVNDVIADRLSSQDARNQYARAVVRSMRGEPVPYTQQLQFITPTGPTADPDEIVLKPKE